MILALAGLRYCRGSFVLQPNPGQSLTISLPLPREMWDSRELVQVGHLVNGELEILPHILEQDGEVWLATFEATSFSPYALIFNTVAQQSGPNDAQQTPATPGDGSNPVAWIAVLVISAAGLSVHRGKRKHKDKGRSLYWALKR